MGLLVLVIWTEGAFKDVKDEGWESREKVFYFSYFLVGFLLPCTMKAEDDGLELEFLEDWTSLLKKNC